MNAPQDSSSPEQLLELAEERFRNGDLEGAGVLYRRFLAEAPRHSRAAQARLALGRLLAQQGRQAEAQRVFVEVERLHADTRWAREASAERQRLERRPAELPAAASEAAPSEER